MKRFWKWICKTKTRTLSLCFAILYMIVFDAAALAVNFNGGAVQGELIWCNFAVLLLIIAISGVLTLKIPKVKSVKLGEVEVNMGDNNDESDYDS